ncbi:MAG: hypothetical protein E7262_01265 [Lachnospiraceae bacterium]|nr:hypothetical protein [Lachnospiraceae bacterium]
MTDTQLQNYKSAANVLMQSNRVDINNMLAATNKLKNVEIENADIKETIDTMIEDIEKQLNSLMDEMNTRF